MKIRQWFLYGYKTAFKNPLDKDDFPNGIEGTRAENEYWLGRTARYEDVKNGCTDLILLTNNPYQD
jgi:hypothetical protein